MNRLVWRELLKRGGRSRAAWIMVAVVLSASAADFVMAAEEGGGMVYSERQTLLGFDPVFRANVATTRFCALIFEQLLEREHVGLGVKCRLCETYDMGARVVTFRLKKNLKWHDGQSVDSEDVAFSFRVISNPRTGSPLATELENIEDVTVIDKTTVVFSLREAVSSPESYFLALPILPAHKFTTFSPSLKEDPDPGRVREIQVPKIPLRAEPTKDSRVVGNLSRGAQVSVLGEKAGWVEIKVIARGPAGRSGWIPKHNDFISKTTNPAFLVRPVGTGPYRFLRAMLNGDVSLKRFQDYHGERKPYILRIRRKRTSDVHTMVSRLTAEIIDLIPETPMEELPRIAGSGVAKTISYPSLKFAGFLFNCRHPLLKEKVFRQAMTVATNRKLWIETFYQGHGTVVAGPASPDSWLYDPRIEPLSYDLRRAKKLLATVTKQKEIRLNLIASNERPNQDMDMLRAFADSMELLGIQITITVMERGVFERTLAEGNFDIAFTEYLFGYGYNFRPLFEPRGVQNYGAYSNDRLTELLRRWRIESDFEEIRSIAYESQKIITEDCPFLFLWSMKNVATVSNKLRNVRAETIDPYRFFAWIHLWWIPSEYH